MASPTTLSARDKAQAFVDNFNRSYEEKHVAFENQFWGTKMALSSTEESPYSTELLTKTKAEMEDLLSDPAVIKEAKEQQEALANAKGEDVQEVLKVLDVIVRTCRCNEFPTPESKAVREETNKIEGSLEKSRNEMTLGYTNEEGEFIKASSVGLRTVLRTAPSESTRKSAYDGLRSIGAFVCSNGFLEIVRLRNKLAHLLGFEDYYDYTVTNAEGFSKSKLFEILDGLEEGTRPLMAKARKDLEELHGVKALDPWNTSYMMAGSVVKKMDPYFPFSKSVENYLRSYAAMNIGYSNATMTLDLLDRKNKYSNGFCHWPVPAWIKPDGTHVPSQTNFTSLADPAAVGSGLTALNTLMHEAGHAAHFANIAQPSPLFSQERAPTSVAYAENQSMFLDSLVGDSAWRAKYAKDLQGTPIPFAIIEEDIRAKHPFAVFQLRAMLSVSYFEKALYELPEAELTAEKVQSLADEVEIRIQGGLGARPLLSVPHLVSDEASCYYQGYTLAEMSVHQTRKYFKDKYGYIVDNPNVGPTLTESYWKCGNSKPFLQIVKDLTGKELSGDDWVDALKEDLEEHIAQERKEYDGMISKCEASSAEEKDGEEPLDLAMTVKFVDGDHVISDSSQSGLLSACKEFEAFVAARVAAAKASS
ncbi:unnamed protein product [Pseudo-nitzschia multistriata]|uniref:Peptidase M3A/M3B catalytic domain-containing protein n=1 Tax=Pseudo-nitzschia multistriata TaxID=183589 RepID=A0A448ZM12_9STRA|nr:unnamed protein product [Pseudo-nitzschia multistriata]